MRRIITLAVLSTTKKKKWKNCADSSVEVVKKACNDYNGGGREVARDITTSGGTQQEGM